MKFPGAISKTLLDEFDQLGIVQTRPFVIDLASSRGMNIATVDGHTIIDWAGFYGSRLLGYNHAAYSEPAFRERLMSAALTKTANPDFVTPELIDYYRFLHRIAPKSMDPSTLRVYTVNSGAEAVENALKYCVNRYFHKYGPGKPNPRFMSFDGGFHGRTVYALSVTDMPHNPAATRDYHRLVGRTRWVPFPAPDMNSVSIAIELIKVALKRYGDGLAGIIVEPMQGAGGHNVTLPLFFQILSELAHQHDVPLIFDEVQTAGGQCGSMWMIDQFDLPHSPTCVVSAKKLGCGVLYMNDLIPDSGVLDSTWSGHIVDMVRVPHEFDIIDREGLIDAVGGKTRCLTDGLQELQARHPVVTNIRGTGLYQGFSLPSRVIRDEIVERALQEQDLLLLRAGTDTIRFRPNICVTTDDIDDLIERLDHTLRTL